MTYTQHKPPNAETSEQLRARIPGWGVDLDPADRPAVPKEKFNPRPYGAVWEFPDRQAELVPRERSIEHKFLTPVFGTTCPPRGASGAIRKLAYRRYSDGRAAHWLLLMAADRADTFESTVRSFATRRPDNLVTETGIRAELKYHGLRSRRNTHRADRLHQTLDPILITAPWIATAILTYKTTRRLRRILTK